MNELQIFKSKQFGQVRVIEEDGKVLFCGSDIARALGYANPRKALADHCKGVTKRNTPTTGGVQELSYILEGDLYRLVTHSKLPQAERFESWIFDEVLPSIRKHGSYIVDREPKNRIPFTEQVESVNIVSNMLNVNEAGKILMLQKLYRSYDLPYEFLPKYEDNGSREYKSATELLKRFNLDMSARAFNILLMDKGYLEERTRASSKNKSARRKYKALSEKGLDYGENLISPQNQRETQPMYYVDTFMELFEMITQ